MRIVRSILSCIIALHLLVATSGVPLSYTFCGEDVYSWAFAVPNAVSADSEDVASSEDSCCDEQEECRVVNECRTELHSAKLSLDMLEPSSALVSQITPVVEYCFFLSNDTSHIAPISAVGQFFLDKPPPYRFDRTVAFRVFLI